MVFAGTNLLAVLVAAIVAFAFGAAYYGLLGRLWMKAARLSPDEVRPTPMPFIVSFIAELVMAFVLAGAIGHLGGPEVVTIGNGVVSAAILWAGLVLTTIAVNHRYQGFGWDLTLIDASHWLGVLVLMGAVIGAFGV